MGDSEEVSVELVEFIGRAIVPLLLDVLKTDGHLYGVERSYDDEDGNDLAQAA